MRTALLSGLLVGIATHFICSPVRRSSQRTVCGAMLGSKDLSFLPVTVRTWSS